MEEKLEITVVTKDNKRRDVALLQRFLSYPLRKVFHSFLLRFIHSEPVARTIALPTHDHIHKDRDKDINPPV